MTGGDCLKFRHLVINDHTIGAGNSVCLVSDINGDAQFKECLIDSWNPTHEAKLADIGNNGIVDIIGKPFYPKTQVDLWDNPTT